MMYTIFLLSTGSQRYSFTPLSPYELTNPFFFFFQPKIKWGFTHTHRHTHNIHNSAKDWWIYTSEIINKKKGLLCAHTDTHSNYYIEGFLISLKPTLAGRANTHTFFFSPYNPPFPLPLFLYFLPSFNRTITHNKECIRSYTLRRAVSVG